MKVKSTCIVYIEYNNYHFDDEYVKLHELENGNFIKEDWRGKLSKFDKEQAQKLISQ